MPGKLSVSRAFGNIEAKSPLFNGNPNVIIAKPDIKYFDINPNYDFIVLGCDGIFENMKNKELIEIIWKNTHKETHDIHNKCGVLVESVINDCINKKFTDNLTVVLISFKDELKLDLSDKYGLRSEHVNKHKLIQANKDNIEMNNNFDTLNSEEKSFEGSETPTHRVKDFSKLCNFVYNSNADPRNNINNNKKKILENIFKIASDKKDKFQQNFITLKDSKNKLIRNKTEGDINFLDTSNKSKIGKDNNNLRKINDSAERKI
jgi:hypothetical protein